ncbi:MAG TPA: gamma-glutamyltransferase family protein [Burkholderiales bacterium]|nr:gamma-glutamyltransferase family protein [Burkholderiales bacterium]
MTTSYGVPFTTRPEIKGMFGVAASTHWLATAVAMRTLERGGNAFDAAVACAFTLQVVEPHLNSPGGEVPLILWSAKERRARVLCGQGTAPAKATIAAFRALDLKLVPGTGLLPATVPGAFDAWMQLLRDYGTLPLREVLEPAIYYAGSGYPLVPRISQAIVAVERLFREHWPSSAAVYLPAPKPGTLFRNSSLSETYRHVLREAEAVAGREQQIEKARDAWYRGFVAAEIDRFYREEIMDCSGRRNRGLLTAQDMAGWQATYEEPLARDYRGYTVLKCGPWSQGLVLLQQLALAEHLDLERLDPLGDEFVHRIAESAKLCFADRDAWLGDPGFVEVPANDLLAKDYARQRAQLVGSKASREFRPGSPGGRKPRLPGFAEESARLAKTASSSLGIGEPPFAELVAGDTCHLDVIDRWGNVVSATPSGGWLSSSPVVPALGFSVNTRLQISWLDESLPGALAPGKRPSTTLSPSLALRDGEPYLSFGTPGGDQQDQWQAIFFLRHVHHRMNLQQAIDAPAWHINHFVQSFWPRTVDANRLTLESRFEKSVLENLRRRGHEVVVGEPWSEGRLSACAKDGNLLRAAANPRGMQGYAAGR